MTMTATITSMLPTPPNSPSPSRGKPATTLQIGLCAHPVEDAQALSKPTPATVVNATSTTNTILTGQDPTINRPARTLAALKEDLKIKGWRCGAETKSKTKCRNFVNEDTRNLIDAQLASMTELTCAAPDFESALLTLVKLLHCYQHNAGKSKEGRLEEWRLAFPSGNADGSPYEVPIERRIRKALEPFSTECIAHDYGALCEEKIGGWKVQNCERTLQELIKQETYSDGDKLEFMLKVLEWNKTCKVHQSSKRFNMVVGWKKSMMAVLPAPMGNQAITDNALNKPQTSERAQAGPLIATTSSITEEKDVLTMKILSSQRSLTDHVSPDADPALYWPKTYDSSPFNILPPADGDASPKRLHKLVRDEASRQLDPMDFKHGCVYVYQVEGNPDYVKIGYTTRPVSVRHDEWSFDCNRLTKPLYPSPPQAAAATLTAKEAAAAPVVLVPHARRVEALCHAELDHRRIRIYCTACLKQHIEWFEVSATEAIAVVQKWSTWMTTQPYELRELRVRSKWTLKADEISRMSKFDQFMQEIAEAPVPRRKEQKD